MHTMALDQSALLELLDAPKSADADDVVRRSLEAVFQALIEAEATARIGAEPYQRTETRTTQRNGYRDRLVTTAAEDVELRIPKLRTGSFFPSLLERRRRIDQALFAVVMEAHVTGTSTRKVDELVVAMGADTGISKSEVSRICADLDVEVTSFRDRSLVEVAFPYVFLDACFCKARIGGDRRGRGRWSGRGSDSARRGRVRGRGRCPRRGRHAARARAERPGGTACGPGGGVPVSPGRGARRRCGRPPGAAPSGRARRARAGWVARHAAPPPVPRGV
jgi:Transposase, Mutator family